MFWFVARLEQNRITGGKGPKNHFSLTWIPDAEMFWKSGATPAKVFNLNVEVLEISREVGYCGCRKLCSSQLSLSRTCPWFALTRPDYSYPLMSHPDTQLLETEGYLGLEDATSQQRMSENAWVPDWLFQGLSADSTACSLKRRWVLQ